jgi:hypothetical protein
MNIENIKYSPGNHGNFNVGNNPNFNKIILLINNIVNNEYNIDYNGNYKVLYFRDDADKRKMIGYNQNLNNLFDEIITDMSILSFDEQVKLFMKCSHLVTIDGAHMTNILFMNKNAKILNINTVSHDCCCWTLNFGLYKCINPDNFFKLSLNYSYDKYNEHILYNSHINNTIINFLTK